MAVNVKNILLACKSLEGCTSAAKITAVIAKAYNSKVLALTEGSDVRNLTSFISSDILRSEQINGSVVKSIKEHASSGNTDLIVLPVKGNGSEVGIVSSSEANSIIDYLERVVLTVPAGTKDFSFSKIVVPIDSSFETRQKVPYAESIAKIFGSTIHVLGVSSDSGKDAEVTVSNYTRQVCRNVEEQGLKFETETNLGGNPTDQTIEYANKIGADLIVIMTEQESNLTSFFSGKYSEQMIKKSSVPVLSVHPRDLVVSEARL